MKLSLNTTKVAQFAICTVAVTVAAVSIGKTISAYAFVDTAPIAPFEIPAQKQTAISHAKISPDLFGKSTGSSELVKATKLNIKLNGVMPSDTPDHSIAIVSYNGKPDKLVKVGEEIANGVLLVAVDSEGIELDVSGKREAVFFPKKKHSTSEQKHVANTVKEQHQSIALRRNEPKQYSPEVSDFVVKSAIKSPAMIAKAGGIAFKGASAVIGRNSMIGKELGLSSGDQILTVNGTPLRALMSNPNEMMNLRGQQVNIMVLKGGKRETIAVTVP